MAYFSYLPLELNAVSSEQVFRSIVVLRIYSCDIRGVVLGIAVVIAKLKA